MDDLSAASMRPSHCRLVVYILAVILAGPSDAMVTRSGNKPLSRNRVAFDNALPSSWEADVKIQRQNMDSIFSDLDEEDDEDLEFEVNDFQELQRSTGTEVLNEELQQQIDDASPNANRFLDALVSDASYMEKVAMSSIPEQLPRPAVNALSRKSTHKLNFSETRVTREQEIELGKMIQKGVTLHKLRSDFEEDAGREISRREWVDIAGLESAKELRRSVSDYRRAKQLLVAANMGLVHAVVKQQYYGRNGVSRDELVQEGSLGLMRAAELFDASRGLRFSTYATIWIKGVLSNSNLVETIKLPAREKTKINKIAKAEKELSEANGGGSEPTIEELANHLGMKVSDVIATKRKMKQAQNVLSLDYEYMTQTRSGGETGRLNRLESDPAFMADVDLAERTQMHADIVATMARNLDAREARLMRLRYGLSDGRTRSLSECADAMGLSQTRVQQLAKRCLKKMREAADAESLDEYLLTIA